MIRKTKTMAQILKEFTGSEFLISDVHKGVVELFNEKWDESLVGINFPMLGKEIDTKFGEWNEDWLVPVEKKKTIKLFRYFYKYSDDTIEGSRFISRTWADFSNDVGFSNVTLLCTEEKEIDAIQFTEIGESE